MTWMSDKMSSLNFTKKDADDKHLTDEEKTMKVQMDKMNKELDQASVKNQESAMREAQHQDNNA